MVTKEQIRNCIDNKYLIYAEHVCCIPVAIENNKVYGLWTDDEKEAIKIYNHHVIKLVNLDTQKYIFRYVMLHKINRINNTNVGIESMIEQLFIRLGYE